MPGCEQDLIDHRRACCALAGVDESIFIREPGRYGPQRLAPLRDAVWRVMRLTPLVSTGKRPTCMDVGYATGYSGYAVWHGSGRATTENIPGLAHGDEIALPLCEVALVAHRKKCCAIAGHGEGLFVRTGGTLRRGVRRSLAHARAEVWRLMRDTPVEGWGRRPSYPEIGRATGYSHNGVLYALRRVRP